MVSDAMPPRPVAVVPDPEGLAELRAIDSWGNWQYTWTGDKWDKPPQSPWGGAAKTNAAQSWGSFDIAWKRTQDHGLDGIGFRVARTFGVVIIDIDGCVRPDGAIESWALAWVRRLRTAVFLSPSATGLHLPVYARAPWSDSAGKKKIVVANVPTWARDKQAQVEILVDNCYACLTGVVPAGVERLPVAWNEEGVRGLWQWLVAQGQRRGDRDGDPTGRGAAGGRDNGHRVLVEATSPAMSDEEIILRARNAKNGAAFAALFDRGDLSAYKGDHSAADLALCCMVAFWTQDPQQIDRIFRRSKLARSKWDEVHYSGGETYGEHTIAKALDLATEHYSPPAEPEDEPARETGAAVDGAEAGQDSAAGPQWTGPRDWAQRGPLTPEEVRAMRREQLEHFAIVVSRWQYDLYHLLTNEARVHDVETGKDRPALKPTDKVVTACAWFEANRAPGLEHPTGRPVVLTRRDGIARGAGVHADTVGKTLDHVSAAGLVVKDVRTAFRDGERHEDMYLGAPAVMPRNTDPLPMEAAHRAKDRRRKKCPHCGASVFVHRTVCGGCGEVLDQRVDGDDEAAVAAVQAKLNGATEPAPRASVTGQTGRPQTEDSSDIPYSTQESSEIKEYNHVYLAEDSSVWRMAAMLVPSGDASPSGKCSDCGAPIPKAWGRCASCRSGEYARLGLEDVQ